MSEKAPRPAASPAPAPLSVDVEVRLAHLGPPFVLDVAFEAPPGVTVLFGPSGAGKSTALRAIAGLVTPARGHIRLGDERWFDADAGLSQPPERRRVGYVAQTLALFPHLSALKNVAYGIERTLSRAERRQRARELLGRVGAGHLAQRKVPTLSGGEAQRVALARALARRPRLLLLDEPLSALDRARRDHLVTLIRDLVAELAIPLVHVTHDLSEAETLGDRHIHLDHGHIVGAPPGDAPIA